LEHAIEKRPKTHDNLLVFLGTLLLKGKKRAQARTIINRVRTTGRHPNAVKLAVSLLEDKNLWN